MDLKDKGCKYEGWISLNSVYEPVVGCCEFGIETSFYKRDGIYGLVEPLSSS